ncbi:hypothetical protein HLH17_09305 [Acinetobacter sp. ANC 5380]|uniref:Uncharacterized protein n=1 Tax=Acinetobacter terrae TaxID=2731247 RepID=A0A7Y2WBM8_9GAMM|nr:hypothetical protein [Acinetobacter terrae]NNH77853.1 hypothetical protein [Acinetobacter terrae]
MSIPAVVKPLISELSSCGEHDYTDTFISRHNVQLAKETNKIYLVKSARDNNSSQDNDLSEYEEREEGTVVKRYLEWEIGSKHPPFSTSLGCVEI